MWLVGWGPSNDESTYEFDLSQRDRRQRLGFPDTQATSPHKSPSEFSFMPVRECFASGKPMNRGLTPGSDDNDDNPIISFMNSPAETARTLTEIDESTSD